MVTTTTSALIPQTVIHGLVISCSTKKKDRLTIRSAAISDCVEQVDRQTAYLVEAWGSGEYGPVEQSGGEVEREIPDGQHRE